MSPTSMDHPTVSLFVVPANAGTQWRARNCEPLVPVIPAQAGTQFRRPSENRNLGPGLRRGVRIERRRGWQCRPRRWTTQQSHSSSFPRTREPSGVHETANHSSLSSRRRPGPNFAAQARTATWAPAFAGVTGIERRRGWQCRARRWTTHHLHSSSFSRTREPSGVNLKTQTTPLSRLSFPRKVEFNGVHSKQLTLICHPGAGRDPSSPLTCQQQSGPNLDRGHRIC